MRRRGAAGAASKGLYPAELAAWQQDAIVGLGEPHAVSAAEVRQDRRRVKDLERELHRKDRALAETAALLVLSKKLSAVFHKDAETRLEDRQTGDDAGGTAGEGVCRWPIGGTPDALGQAEAAHHRRARLSAIRTQRRSPVLPAGQPSL